MFKAIKLLSIAAIAIGFTTPVSAASNKQQVVSCTIEVNANTETYQKSFDLRPGVNFSDDFSTPTRSKTLDAFLITDASGKPTDVQFVYFNDVGVFDSVELSGIAKFVNNQNMAYIAASSRFFTSNNRQINSNYAMTCVKR